jgi:hypothetical protein
VGFPCRASGKSEPGTHEVQGTRSSFGWQTSVGRVAHLSHPSVARPAGARRALAWKKFAAPPDAGREWTEGETARGYGISEQVFPCTVRGLTLAGSRYDERRSRAPARHALTSKATQSPSGSQVKSASPSARSVMTDSTSGGDGSRLGCAYGRRWERQRSTRLGEGSSRSNRPRRVRILGAEKAPVQRCAES